MHSTGASTGILILLLLLGSSAARPGLSTTGSSEDAEFIYERRGRSLQGALGNILSALWGAALEVGTSAAESAVSSAFSGGGGSSGGSSSGGGSGGGGGGSCPSMGSCCCWDTKKNPCNPKCSSGATSCGSACA